jgi:flagellar basal body-associated protein FliL
VPQAGAPPKRQTAAAVVAVSVLIVLAAAAVASLLMADRDAAGADHRSPEEVVRDYFTAADRDDCEIMLDLVSVNRLRYSGAGSRGEAMEMCTAAAEAHTDRIEVVSTDVVEAEEDDDYAIISVELEVGSDHDEREIVLYREAGEWKLFDSEVFDEA